MYLARGYYPSRAALLGHLTVECQVPEALSSASSNGYFWGVAATSATNA